MIVLGSLSLFMFATAGTWMVYHSRAPKTSRSTAPADTPKYRPIEKNGKWGYQNQEGETVIAPRFEQVRSFSDGLAPVKKDANGPWGYIDRDGNVAIPPRFEYACAFNEGLAPVQIHGQWGYIDRSGSLQIPPRFKDARPFSEGFAAVMYGWKYGYINQKGEFVITPRYVQASEFRDGKARVNTGICWETLDHARVKPNQPTGFSPMR